MCSAEIGNQPLSEAHGSPFLVELVPGGVIPWDHGFGAKRLVPEAAMVGAAVVPHGVERHEAELGHLGADSERARYYPTCSSLPTGSSRSAMRPREISRSACSS